MWIRPETVLDFKNGDQGNRHFQQYQFILKEYGLNTYMCNEIVLSDVNGNTERKFGRIGL
jgi:hypothetical protein